MPQTELVLQALTQALVLIVLASATLAVGLGIICGLVWVYLKLGRWLMTAITRAYDEAVAPLEKKRVEAV